MRFMDDESITGVKEFAVGNYLVQMVSHVITACKLNQHRTWSFCLAQCFSVSLTLK